MKLLNLFFILLNVTSTIYANYNKYTPDWPSLDKRPLPTWYDDAKVGIFLHWGVFSVPSYKSEWFWWDWQGNNPSKDVVDFMSKNYPPNFTYADFGNEFTTEFFDPNEWANIFSASGAKYVVLTSKHHEGFCLWPSANSWNWNSVSIGPKRDLVGDLANAIRKNTNLTFGLYHSLFEWFNPLYLSDKSNNFATQDFVTEKTMPELYDLINKYKPEVIWSDGEWEASDNYWNSTAFLAWLYNESPVKDTVVVNDRWGTGDLCKHGDFYTCTDNYNPGKLLSHKWENCLPLDSQSWGYRRDMKLADVHTIEYIISSLVETVSCGGNILINIGPTKDGHIPPIFEERLRQLGSWLKVNGEAIYSTKPWIYQNDTVNSDVWYTSKENSVYAMILKYPTNPSKVVLGAPIASEATQIELLGYNQTIIWVQNPSDKGITLDISDIDLNNLPSQWALVFKISNLS